MLLDTLTPLDRLVPHLPEMWPLYWLAYPFVALGGGAGLIHLSDVGFQRATTGLVAMTVIGAVVQVILPAQAPWPAVPALVQQGYHASPLIMPYATLASMHVAYSAFAAGLLIGTLRTGIGWAVAVLVVILVTLSTLTLKEHVDAVAGLALGLATLHWWRRGLR